MRTLLLTLSLTLTATVLVPAAAQVQPPASQQATTGPTLLSGTSYGLPWGVYAGGETDKTDGDPRLRLSVPAGVRVLGTRYDPQSATLVVTYRSNLNARESTAFIVEQLQQQGFEVGTRRFPTVGRAEATLTRTDRVLDVQAIRGQNGVTNVTYQFTTLGSLMPDSMAPQVQRLLSGTTNAQPWTLVNLPPTRSMLTDNRLYVSAPRSARLVGYRYDEPSRSLLVTYRAGLNAKTALAHATGQLAAQNFVITPDPASTEQNAAATLTREGYPVRVQVGAQSGLVSVAYTFGGE